MRSCSLECDGHLASAGRCCHLCVVVSRALETARHHCRATIMPHNKCPANHRESFGQSRSERLLRESPNSCPKLRRHWVGIRSASLLTDVSLEVACHRAKWLACQAANAWSLVNQVGSHPHLLGTSFRYSLCTRFSVQGFLCARQICLLTAFLHPAESLSGLHPHLERRGVQLGCVSPRAKSKCWHECHVASFVCQHTHAAHLMSNSFSMFCKAKRPAARIATGCPTLTLRMRHIPTQEA